LTANGGLSLTKNQPFLHGWFLVKVSVKMLLWKYG